MTWQILLAISVVTYSISTVLQRVLLKNDKSDPIAYSIVFQLLTGILIGVYTLYHGFTTPNLVPILPNIFLMTFLYGAWNVFIFRALKSTSASDFTIIFASRALWTILGASIFLRESISTQQVFGTILIILSVVLVSWEKRKVIVDKGVVFSALAALFFGLAFANDAFLLAGFDVPSYLTIAFIVPALTIWVMNPRSTPKMMPLFERNTFHKLLVLGFLYAVSAISIFLAYQVGKNVSQIASLNQTATIVTVLLSVIFLRERSGLWRKLLGAIVSFVGVVLVK